MASPEAPLLQRLNTLKQIQHQKYLTESQQEALETIKQHRDNGEIYINLYGPKGAGKTFLCWALQTNGWTYHQTFHNRVNNPAVIYDHGSRERRATRELRNNVELNGVACVVYVTRKPAEEVYPRVELTPSAPHYETVAATWEELGLNTEDAPAILNGQSETYQNNTGDKTA